MPNFVLTRTYRVPGTRRQLEERFESRNQQTITRIYDSWWADPNTVTIQLIQRKMDSVELVRSQARS